jgi:hypothetical protein
LPTRPGVLCLAAALLSSGAAQAQGRLDARYTASLAGVPLGRLAWVVDIADDQYSASMSGKTVGVLQVIAAGQGSGNSRGQVVAGKPVAASFAADITSDSKADTVRIALTGGIVKQYSAEPPLDPTPDRVPMTDAHRRAVVDPMTAMLMAVPGKGETLSPEACQRTLPVFDGRGRFDILLTYKRMDTVRSQQGYAGPVVVCMVTYRPVAGHRPDRSAIKYLMRNRDMEVWLAPVLGSRVLVPYRVKVPTALGEAVLQATHFVTAPQTARSPARTH